MSDEDDPALAPFLALLEQDLSPPPERLRLITADLVGHLEDLVGGMDVDLNAPLPDDDTSV